MNEENDKTLNLTKVQAGKAALVMEMCRKSWNCDEEEYQRRFVIIDALKDYAGDWWEDDIDE